MPAELTCLDAEQVNRHWEAKKHEHFQNSAKESMGSLLQDIPTTLPANCRAIKLQNRAAMVGFDWPSIQYVFEKLEEEIAELKMEVDEKADNEAILDEYGDLLFVCMNIARHLGLDPETALRHANQKFTQRFQYIERAIQKSGRTLGESNLEEMNALWEESKVEG
jgi:ATP diphosphatase